MFLIVLGLIVFVVGIAAGKSDGALHKLRNLLRLVGIAVIAVGFFTSAVRQIEPGTVGVQILFGKVEPNVLYEGLNVINPLINIQEMDVRTQNYTMSSVHDEGTKSGDDGIKVICKDGLEVLLDLTILYRLKPESAPTIYRELSVDYQDRFIRAIARTRIRESATNYIATDLYSEKRKSFENDIRESVNHDFAKQGLVLEQLLVRNITLPQSVKESIERKITAVQDAQRMQYVLDKGRQEAELKRVEAQGIADAQKIMSEGLNDKVLQYEMIKVQKELANSPNSKIIVLGGKGAGNMILNP